MANIFIGQQNESPHFSAARMRFLGFWWLNWSLPFSAARVQFLRKSNFFIKFNDFGKFCRFFLEKLTDFNNFWWFFWFSEIFDFSILVHGIENFQIPQTWNFHYLNIKNFNNINFFWLSSWWWSKSSKVVFLSIF